MLRRTLIFLICLVLCFSLPFNVGAVDSLSDQRQHYLKITYDDKVIFHEQIAEGKIIQVKNAHGDIIKSEVLKREEVYELREVEPSQGYVLSYWDIQEDEKYLVVTPVLTEVKAINITFNALEGGELIENNAQTRVITKSVDKGTLLKEVLPKTNPRKDYKLSGWYLKTNDKKFKKIENLTSLEVSGPNEYYAKFYPDINDNNIDDRTEKIKVKFRPNTGKKIKNKTIFVGESFELPKLERKNYIFLGWYYDEDFKNKYSNQDRLMEDTTLYARWEKAEKVLQESESEPITDKEISDQIEHYLNERLREIEEQLLQRSSGNRNESSNSNNDSNNNILDQIDGFELGGTQNNPYTYNEVLTYTETKYVFNNTNIGERYMIKFKDQNNQFLFSLTLPYGRSIHVLHENESIQKEYAVRQETTINLNIPDFVHNESEFIGFDSRTKRVNSSSITEVYPKVQQYQPTDVLVSNELVEELASEEIESASHIIALISTVILLVLVIAIVIYFIFSRQKSKKSDVVNVK
ncbi:InlB B-repeat-containing protein [Alkalihalobacillus sp. LMS39]|uniref:InlB B-repeat-containing protein n=1 Tax=Alkalihalobacillus sp. LMS39 TaxID=2924032 RepID=UPI001FB34DB6|nr:InlB B-repeat-containing protein [Alkalihalobacillus sp. LMS39]UOE94780.1 InlB B-repeat-containing protein [Alkalihalobacillus sp. LMS39]